jgi:hypothetical protein
MLMLVDIELMLVPLLLVFLLVLLMHVLVLVGGRLLVVMLSAMCVACSVVAPGGTGAGWRPVVGLNGSDVGVVATVGVGSRPIVVAGASGQRYCRTCAAHSAFAGRRSAATANARGPRVTASVVVFVVDDVCVVGVATPCVETCSRPYVATGVGVVRTSFA